MPQYLYRNEETQEIKEVFQGINDKHEYFEGGVEWKRVFTVPNVGVDTKVDAFSNKAYVEKTGNMKGTIGDLLDYSKELSDKRAESRDGVDPVKKKFESDYKKKTGVDMLQNKPKKFEKNGVKIEF